MPVQLLRLRRSLSKAKRHHSRFPLADGSRLDASHTRRGRLVRVFQEHRLDRIPPSRVEGVQHHRAGSCTSNTVERRKEVGFVVAVAVFAGAVSETHARDGQHLPRDLTQCRAAQLSTYTSFRHRITHRSYLLVGPVGGQRLRGIESRLVVEQSDPERRQRANSPPRSAIGAPHFKEAFQPDIRKERREMTGPVSDRGESLRHGIPQSAIHELAEGHMRKVVTLEIPPLRDRTSDLPVLCEHFLHGFSEEHGKADIRISPQALDALSRHPWPGNVRELRNVLESVVIFHPGGEITVDELPQQFRDAARTTKSAAPIQTQFGTPRTMDEIERQAILETLERTHGRRAEAARLLGIGLRTLQRKLKDYRAQGIVEGG